MPHTPPSGCPSCPLASGWSVEREAKLDQSYEVLRLKEIDNIIIATIEGRDDMHRYPAQALHMELERLAQELRKTDHIRALVVQGSGDVFSFGPLPTSVENTYEPLGPDLSKNTVRHFLRELLDVEVPIITALNGPVMGGVLALVLLSDIIIAEKHVTIRDSHVSTGRPSTAGPFFWVPAVGLMRARRYLLTGEPLGAEEAERIGLVTEVVDKGESFARAMFYAKRVAALSPTAVGGTKRALNQRLRGEFSSVFDAGVAIQFLAMSQPATGAATTADIQREAYEQLRNSRTEDSATAFES